MKAKSTSKTRTTRALKLSRHPFRWNRLKTMPLAELRERMIAAFDEMPPIPRRLVARQLIASAALVSPGARNNS